MKCANISCRSASFFAALGLLFLWGFFPSTVNLPSAHGAAPLDAEAQVFTAASHQDTAPIKVGDTFYIVLEANPSTGYSWQVQGVDRSILKQGKMKFRATSKLLGAPEKQIIPFTAVRSGTTALDLCYERPWEKKTRLESFALQNFRMNLTVTP